MEYMEPMDVDRSSSSASKMDISYNESGADIHVIDDDDDCIILEKSVSDSSYERPKKRYNHSVNNKHIDSVSDSPPELLKTPDKDQILSKSSLYENLHKRKPKKYHIKIKREKNTGVIKFKLPIAIIVGVCLILSYYTFYKTLYFKCAEDIDTNSLKKSFSENIFGQTVATRRIIEAININVSSKIIFLYGGTGVGKTYAVNLMLENLWNYANIYHYTMPTFAYSFSPEMMLGLIMCEQTVLVVDGLNKNDMEIKSQIKELITKSENLKKKLTVVLVYNCDEINDYIKKCDDSFQRELEHNYKDIQTNRQYIWFKPLTQEHLIKCIEKELNFRKISAYEMNSVLKNFDVFLDGCKGVYTRMKYYNVI